MHKAVILLCLGFVIGFYTHDVTAESIHTEPEIMQFATHCDLTKEETHKVMHLPLHNMVLSSDNKCAELRKKLKPMKAWYQ